MFHQINHILGVHSQLTKTYPIFEYKEDIQRAVHIVSAQAQQFLRQQLDHSETRSVDHESYLLSRFIPNRHYIEPFTEAKNHKILSECALCNGNDPLVKFSAYGLRVVSNKYRYGTHSLLLLADPHRRQEEIVELLPQILKLQCDLGSKYTYFFNGLRGNSQRHTHMHALQEKLPIREAIEDGYLLGTKLGKIGSDEISLLDGPAQLDQTKGKRVQHFYGIKITGHYQTLSSSVARVVQAVESVTQLGSYNLVSWIDGTQSTIIVIPRSNASNRAPGVCFSSSDHAGLTIFTSSPCQDTYEQLSEKLMEEIYSLPAQQWQDLLGL